MARINRLGSVIASCRGCDGSTSTYEYSHQGAGLGAITVQVPAPYRRYDEEVDAQFRLFRCAGCGMGGLAYIRMSKLRANYPADIDKLGWFMPEAKQRLSLPDEVPEGIKKEFREAELCLESGAIRAAAGMLRSVLDKTLRTNGYKTNRCASLSQQIDESAQDGIITAARQRRAHEEIRVLGNDDVLHDDWREIPEEDVEAARHYAQRILEDFYDDRSSVEKILLAAGRLSVEDRDDQAEKP